MRYCCFNCFYHKWFIHAFFSFPFNMKIMIESIIWRWDQFPRYILFQNPFPASFSCPTFCYAFMDFAHLFYVVLYCQFIFRHPMFTTLTFVCSAFWACVFVRASHWRLEPVQLTAVESHLCWNLHLLSWNALDFNHPLPFKESGLFQFYAETISNRI